MKLTLAAAILLLLLGCADSTISNDEAIAETKKCEAAGMRAVRATNLDGDTHKIVCIPKGE